MADIIEILDQNHIEYKTTNNPSQILVRCTSGTHTDHNPSLSYDLDRNIFRCFSCDFKGGVTKFLASIGITEILQIENKQQHKINKLKHKLLKLKSVDAIDLPNARNRVLWDFNGVTKEVLSDFNAFTTTDLGLEDYVCLPVYQYQRLRFIDARHRFSDDKKKKYNRKPRNISVGDVLFPIDKIYRNNEVILVEGIYDMLNLWQFGVRNVLCLFGANSFSRDKLALLNDLNITKVTLLLDGDRAGQDAANKIYSMLDYDNFLTKQITLPEEKDPGNLTQQEINHYLKR